MATVVQERSVRTRDQAFERLYQRYVADVYHYSLALLRNPADAEDVTQTTFMNAYRAFKRGDEIHKPHNWLIKIAHNVARSRYAQSSRRVQEVPLDDHVESLAAANDEKPDVAAVLQALARLPFNQRAALVLRELEGRSYGEIADTLGVSVPAVETLIFRARKTMRLKSSALRVLTGVPLPGSLGQLFGSGGAVAGGGAIAGAGASIVGKALVVLLVGAAATGVGGGRPATGAADSDGAQAIAAAAGTGSKAREGTPRNVAKGRAVKLTILRGGAVGGGRGGAAIAGAAATVGAVDGALAQGPVSVIGPGSRQASPQGGANGPAPATAGAASPGQAASATSPVQTVTDTVTQVVNTVTTALPVRPPALPVSVPTVTVPNLPVNPPSLPLNPPNLPVNPPNLPVSPPNLPVSPPSLPVSPQALPPPPPLPKLP